MAMAAKQRIVSFKMDILVDQRNNLQTLVDEINEVLYLTTSWLGNTDGSNNFTFTEISKMIEDKILFLENINFSVGSKKATKQQESSAEPASQSVPTSIDQKMAARSGLVSEIQTHRQAIGFAASPDGLYLDEICEGVIALPDIISNIGNHYNPTTGEFTTPLEGLYAACLSAHFVGNGGLEIHIYQIPFSDIESHICVRRIVRTKNSSNHKSSFVLIKMKAGDKLYLKCENVDSYVLLSGCSIFSCFRLN